MPARVSQNRNLFHGITALVHLPPLLHTLFLTGFPLLVKRFLVVGEEGVDLLVRILLDRAAGGVIGPTVAGGVILNAVHGDVAVDKDHLELKDLVFIEVELFFHHPELAHGPFGGGIFRGFGLLGGSIGVGILGNHQDMQGQCAKKAEDESLHL